MNTTNNESGQALVELILVVLVCFIMGVGIYETGVLINNISIMNTAMDTATKYASAGAGYDKIKEVVVKEGKNLMTGAFVVHDLSSPGLVVVVNNPKAPGRLGGKFDRTHCKKVFAPSDQAVTPYIFWAQGYTIAVGARYGVGFYLPFLGPITVDTITWSSGRIGAENDLDRDGMRDQYEKAYVQWAMNNNGDTDWKHPVHRHKTAQFTTRSSIDIDGDNVSNDNLPFDYDNDGTEDKYDSGENRMTYNPLVGPDGWSEAVSCS